MNPVKSFNFLYLLTVLLLMAGGCAHLAPIPEKIEPEAAVLLDLIQQNNAKVESLRGYGQLKTINKGKTQLFRVAWLVSRPKWCRFDILSPWGYPTATFAVDKKKLFFYIYAKGTLYKEEATAKNIARFIHVEIAPEELLKVLSGSVPVVPFRQAQVQAGTEGETLLTLIGQWGDIVERVWVRYDPLQVLRAAYFNPEGTLMYHIAFDNFKHITSCVVMPYVIHISGKNSVTWNLTIKKYTINIPISQENFKLEFTRNDKTLDLH
jgi:hypothetical protein